MKMKSASIFTIFVILFAQNSFANLSHTFKINNLNLVIEKGDITKCKTEAIVNAANEELLGGAGVCGAIFKAAGWNELQYACNQYPINNGIRCSVGQACITDSFKLKSNGIKYIIHAVGPDCRIIKDKTKQDQLLESAYKNSLILAEKNCIKSIAFPFISSAIYAFPKERAANIALDTIIEHTKTNINISSIHFILFSKEDLDLFCKIIKDKLNQFNSKKLKDACKNNTLEQVKDLIRQGINVNEIPSSYEKSALMIAAENANIEIMKELIKAKADVNYNEGCDWPRAGRTVLTYAIHSGSFDAVRILVEAGANVEVIADVPHEFNILKPSTRNVPHISYAIMVNASIKIIEILIQFSKNINKTDIYIGWTPYMIASYYKNTQAMAALSKAGADTNLRSKL